MEAESSASTSTHDRGPASDNAELRTQSVWRSPVTCCHHRFMALSDALICRREDPRSLSEAWKVPNEICINMPLLALGLSLISFFPQGCGEGWPAKRPSHRPPIWHTFLVPQPPSSPILLSCQQQHISIEKPSTSSPSSPRDSRFLSLLSQKPTVLAGHPSLAPPPPALFLQSTSSRSDLI